LNHLLKIEFEQRIFGLDLLRFFAIFFVMYRHANDLILPYANKEVLKIFEMDGVTIFFVLSGFLIGRILLKMYFKNETLQWRDLKNFWARRWLRTIPPYFLVLTILVALKLWLAPNNPINYFQFYAFVQNLWYPHPLFFGEAYSLSVEEWFYFSFPLLLFVLAIVLKQQSKPAFLFVVGCFILLSMLFKTFFTIKAHTLGIPIHYIYKDYIQKIVLCRFDSLMAGVLAAYIFYFHQKKWEKHKEFCFLTGLTLLFIYKLFPWLEFEILRGVGSFLLVSFGVALLLPKLNSIQLARGWFSKFIVVISVISYGMYLINLTLRQVLIDYLPVNSTLSAYVNYVLFWILTIIASLIFYRIIEYPILKFRDRLYKKQHI